MSVDTNLLPPRYRDVELIGHGGMGEIYRARDEALGRTVAVKVLVDRYAADRETRQRFKREALAAARLSGEPTVVTIFDVGEWNGRPYIVMEHLEGGSLDQLQRKHGPLPPARALAVLEQAARAIDAAHANGIVHRDLKPANLLLDGDGNVHVVDFGIASAAGLDSLTLTGTVLGTAGYLSPEQARGERVTAASDRYAFAVVAFELLAGRRPFDSDSPTAEALAHVQAPVPAISDVNPRLPPELDPVFRRALAKDPGERYDSCAQLVAAVRDAFAAAAGTTAQRPAVVATPPVTERARPVHVAQRRRRWLPLALAGLLAVGIAGVALAALVTDDGGGNRQSGRSAKGAQPRTATRKVTVTERGTTATVTVTTTTPTAPAASPPAATPPASPGASGGATAIAQGKVLTDQATALMHAGRYAEALTVSQRALKLLQGTGDTYEGYANFDVGYSLAHLGRCDEALKYLNRREQLLGPNPDVTAAKRRCGVK